MILKGNCIEENVSDVIEQNIKGKVPDRFEFNYLKSFFPLNGNGIQETEKIITGQTILLDFKNKEITIIDEKKYKDHFARKKQYGPYPYEELGFSNDIILLIKVLLFYGSDNFTDECLNFPKYVIANRKRIVDRCIDDIEFENAIVLWGITDNNYSYDAYKSLYYKSNLFMLEAYKLFAKRENKNIKKQKLVLITGPCGVGKTALSEKLSKELSNTCTINGDSIYHMINTMDTPAKDFSQGADKLRITFKNSVNLINNFLENGMNVIFEYIIFPEDLNYIVSNIKYLDNVEIRFVLLCANEETIIKRNCLREKNNSERGIELIKIFENYNFDTKYVLKTDNSSLEELCKDVLTNDRLIYNG